jgi:hypothetical protein
VGGSLKETVPHNDFICTVRSYSNFVLRLKFKLVGTEGFVNGGVQVRSKHVQDPPYELSGYQIDMGDPEWWGCLYDESRRNKVVAKSNATEVNKVLKRNDWNEYVIRCEGKRLRASLNGYQTFDYTEPDDAIPQYGIIGLQVHGGGKTEASYKKDWALLMSPLNNWPGFVLLVRYDSGMGQDICLPTESVEPGESIVSLLAPERIHAVIEHLLGGISRPVGGHAAHRGHQTALHAALHCCRVYRCGWHPSGRSIRSCRILLSGLTFDVQSRLPRSDSGPCSSGQPTVASLETIAMPLLPWAKLL